MEVGVPCARVNNFQEVFEHPQIVARGVVQEIEHPRLGTMKVTRNPVLLDHGGPDIARPAPMLGEHSEEILRELGYDAAAIGKLVSGGRDQARRAAGGRGRGISARNAAGPAALSWISVGDIRWPTQNPTIAPTSLSPASPQRAAPPRPTTLRIRPATAPSRMATRCGT